MFFLLFLRTTFRIVVFVFEWFIPFDDVCYTFILKYVHDL